MNPAEQIWQQWRDRDLANRCYDSYDDIIDACCEAWNKFTQVPNAIRSLCTQLGMSHPCPWNVMTWDWYKTRHCSPSQIREQVFAFMRVIVPMR
ncbi:MAG: hypothetical protein ACJ8G3_06435 [Burkholderiaceae bacterium]